MRRPWRVHGPRLASEANREVGLSHSRSAEVGDPQPSGPLLEPVLDENRSVSIPRWRSIKANRSANPYECRKGERDLDPPDIVSRGLLSNRTTPSLTLLSLFPTPFNMPLDRASSLSAQEAGADAFFKDALQ